MNREIKFRGKRVDNREWVYGYYALWQNDHVIFPLTPMGRMRKVNPETVGQATGHTLKSKDLYHHDIIRVEEDSDDGTEIIYVVIEWVKEWGMWAALLLEEYHAYQLQGLSALDEPMFWAYTLEDTDDKKHFLAGNIHDNPELLNQDI